MRSLIVGTMLSLALISFTTPAPARAAEAGDAGANAPLVLTPDNTVILDGPPGAGGLLQYHLTKYYVSEAAAEPLNPTGGKGDRTAVPQFPIVRDNGKFEAPAGKKILAVGQTKFLSAEDKERLDKNPGSVLLKRQGDVVVIAGGPVGDGGATQAAVSEFLNQVAGIRFYAPGDLWNSRPDSKEMKVGTLDFFRPQAFATSHLAPWWERNAEWIRMNPNASRLSVSSNHNLANIFAPEKHAKAHPEIYEMRGGERRVPTNIGTQIWNPCLSAAALPDLAMEFVRETKKARPGATYISFGVMDIEFECECDACQASVKASGGSYSNLYYAFLNKVAKQAGKEFPGLWLTSLLYSNVRTPPTNIERLEPNIVVKVVTKTYKFIEPEAYANEKARIKAFSDLGASWMIHDWSFSGVSPRSYMRQYAGFLQWAKQNNMMGLYVEYSPGESWYLDGAKYWVLLQLINDPYQDVDLLWKTYCNDMYGSAGETMFKFYQHFQDKYVYAPERIVLADLPRQEPVLYTDEDLAFQRSLLEKAVAATKGDELVQKRLAMVMRYFVGHELFADAANEPHSLDWNFKGDGVNKGLLAFYVNDDGSKLDRAIRYFDTERTVAPDTNYMDLRLGLRTSYINNYTRGLAGLLRTIRTKAAGDIAPGAALDKSKVEAVVAKSKAILRENLPEKSLPERVATIEGILSKSMWVPTAAAGEAVKIDADLSDAAWAKAATLEQFTERDTLKTPKDPTSGKVMRVGDKLVVAVVCKQEGPVWAQSPKETLTGTHIWRESGVEFFFGPLPTPGAGGEGQGEFAQYIVNAFGAFRGFRAANNNREGVEAAVKLDEAAKIYTIEAAFPLKGPGYDYTKEKVLTFNACRNVYTRDSYESDVILGWHPIFATAQNLESRGLVFFE